jgi:tetratricopeptide (TPR) repeat protein
MYTATPSSRGLPSATNLTPAAIFVIVIAVILGGALYVNALDNPFVYDDYRTVVENRSLLDLSNVRALLWRDISRPVVNVSYAIDRALWGPGPFGFHLTNVCLHMINVALFALVCWRLMQDLASLAGHRSSSASVGVPVAALLFAVHPMQTGAVGYISGRSEVICGTFFFLALLSARRWMTGGARWWLATTFVCWGFALASKEIAAMLPLVLLGWDRWVLRGDAAAHRRRAFGLHAPLLGTAVALVAIRLVVFLAVEHGGGVQAQWRFALVAADAIRRYLTLLLVPVGQAIFHAATPYSGLLDVRAWPGLVVVGVVAGIAWTQRRSRPDVALGLLWFLLLLLPSSALVVMDRGETMAEHRVYVASAGIFLVAAGLAGRVASRLRRPASTWILRAGVAAMVVALAGRTLIRNAVWDRPVEVWLEAAERAPGQWLPNLVLGEELHRAGRHADAVAAYRRVIAVRPEESSVYGKLGVCLAEQGDVTGAEQAFLTLRAAAPQSVEAANGLAVVTLLRGQVDAARQGYLGALKLDPESLAARRGLVVVEETAGRPAEALRWCEEIRRVAPEAPDIDDCIRRNQARIGAGRDGGR